MGPIYAVTIQKNSGPSVDIVLQFINALAKLFSYTLTDVANYVSSLSSTGITVSLMSHMPSSKTNHMLSINQLNLVSTISTYQNKLFIPIGRINAKVDVLNGFIEEKYRENWLQNYMN